MIKSLLVKKMNKILNIGIVAHVDAGKTSITEQMLLCSGSLKTAGSVDRGTAHTDWLEVERRRGISVKAASTTFDWNGVQINLIDTPGHVDFAGEVERCLSILDAAVLVISAAEGIQAQTEILWKALRGLEIPTVIFINKIDRIGAEPLAVAREIRRKFSSGAVLLETVTETGGRTCKVTEAADQAPLVEAVAEQDDAIAALYIEDRPISKEKLHAALKKTINGNKCFPILFGSAICGVGIKELLDCLTGWIDPEPPQEGGAAGVVYKVEHDAAMGRVAHIRLYGGRLQNRDSVTIQPSGAVEKVTQIRRVYAGKTEDTGRLEAGDIAAVYGLSSVKTGDRIGAFQPRSWDGIANPLLTVQAYPVCAEELTSLSQALSQLSVEEPLLDFEWVKEEREMHLKIMGSIQLEIISTLLKDRYGLEAQFSKPSVIYKETPLGYGIGFESYTMPKPCWAVLKFEISPLPRGSGVKYSAAVRDDKLFYKYQRHVETAVPQALKQGLYNWEVTDLEIKLVDGEHHIEHTHPLDFFVATPMAVMNGLANTGTLLLEPYITARITVSEEFSGKVINDILQMRGSFDTPVIEKGTFTAEASLPVADSMDYPERLGILTGGKGTLTTRFEGYKACPKDFVRIRKRRGVNPLDRAKWILYARSAMNQ